MQISSYGGTTELEMFMRASRGLNVLCLHQCAIIYHEAIMSWNMRSL